MVVNKVETVVFTVEVNIPPGTVTVDVHIGREMELVPTRYYYVSKVFSPWPG